MFSIRKIAFKDRERLLPGKKKTGADGRDRSLSLQRGSFAYYRKVPMVVKAAGESTGGKIPSQLSSIKVNFVSCLPKVMTHLAAAGFFGGCLFSALRYSLVAWFFSVIALFQGITGIKALPALLDFSRKVSLRREKA